MELMGLREIAAYLDLSIHTISEYTYRKTGAASFPDPVMRVGKGGRYRLWNKADIDKWNITRPGKPGNPNLQNPPTNLNPDKESA